MPVQRWQSSVSLVLVKLALSCPFGFFESALSGVQNRQLATAQWRCTTDNASADVRPRHAAPHPCISYDTESPQTNWEQHSGPRNALRIPLCYRHPPPLSRHLSPQFEFVVCDKKLLLTSRPLHPEAPHVQEKTWDKLALTTRNGRSRLCTNLFQKHIITEVVAQQILTLDLWILVWPSLVSSCRNSAVSEFIDWSFIDFNFCILERRAATSSYLTLRLPGFTGSALLQAINDYVMKSVAKSNL